MMLLPSHGTGLGGGIISNGEIVHGHNSGAEIGHLEQTSINDLNVIVVVLDVLKQLLQRQALLT